LPDYARKYGVRGQVRRFAELAQDQRVPVICYPHRWDSVSFYLRRGDVSVFTPENRSKLGDYLREHPRALLFVKGDATDRYVQELLEELPLSLEFVPHQRKGRIVGGMIRWRHGLTDDTIAHQ